MLPQNLRQHLPSFPAAHPTIFAECLRGTELHYRVQDYNCTVLFVLTDLSRNSVVFKDLFCIHNRTMNKQKLLLIQMQLLNFVLHPS